MFGGKFNHEARFFADGYELSGVDNVTFSYNNAANIIKPLGTRDGLTTHSGPIQQTLSVSRVLTYNDPIFSYTGEAPISGSIFYEDDYYGFETGYLVDYSLNCAVGAVPRVSCNFQIASQMKSGVNANLAPQSHPVIDIPTQGSISITCDNSTTNRVVGFDYGVKCERKAYLTIGSDDIVKVELLPPLEYNATVQLDVDDAFLQDAYSFLEEKENKTLSLNVNGRSGSLIQSVDIPNASLVGEDLQVSADGSTRITLKYIGHSAAYEETSLSGDITYVFDENGAVYNQTSSTELLDLWYDGDPNIYGIQLGENVTKVGFGAFSGCQNLGGDLYIDMDSGSGPTISSIGYSAFEGCTGFDGNLIIEEGLESIGYAAFKNTTLDGDLILPDSLTQISGEAFYGCKNFNGILRLPNEKFSLDDNCFKDCVGFKGDLVIPDKISNSIPSGAFQNCQFNGSLYLGTGIEYIEEFAFYGCDKFKGGLNMPPNLIKIGEAAFSGCKEFNEKLILNSSLQNIGRSSFAGCSQIFKNLDIPDSVTGIQDYAFQYCSNINALNIGANLEYIGVGAFEFCEDLAGEIDFKDVKEISTGAFKNDDKISNVKFNSIESIGSFAFKDCDGLNGDLVLPNSLTDLQDEAFANCINLEGSLTISDSLIKTPYRGFYNCGFSGDLNIGANVEIVGAESFKYCKFASQLVLPDTLEEIQYKSFMGCSFTGDLVLKNNITGVYNEAFRDLRNIKRVFVDFPYTVFKDSNHFLNAGSDVGGSCLYANARDYDDYINQLDNNGLFQGISICRGAAQSRVYRAGDDFILNETALDVPNEWYDIGESNANGNPEVYIDIGTGASAIGIDAFKNNIYLKGIVNIPENVNTIGNYAFQNTSIDKLYLNEGLQYISQFAFSNCDQIKGGVVIPNSVTGIGNGIFEDCIGLDGTLTIGKGLKKVSEGAFSSCENLGGEINIPSNVTGIGNSAFLGCSSFNSLKFQGNNIKSLGNDAFRDCVGISNDLSIPDSVTSIGGSCFQRCPNIASLELGGSVQIIGTLSFEACTSIDSVTLRDNIVSVGNSAFHKCSGIQYAYLDVPETAIGNNNSLRFQDDGPTSDRLLFVSENYIAGYNTASTTAKGGFIPGYYQGNLISIWPEDQNITTYYDQNFAILDSVDGNVIDEWKINNGDGYYLYIGNRTQSIGDGAFKHTNYGTSNLRGTLVVPSSLKSIGDSAFNKTALSSLVSQKGIETIAYRAFYECSFLESVSLPSTLISIGSEAFSSCSQLQEVTIGSNNATSRKTIINSKAFYSSTSKTITNGTVNLGFSVDQVGSRSFADNDPDVGDKWIETLNCSARYIGVEAFKYQGNLSNINLTDKCETIDESAFYECTSLTNVVIPDPKNIKPYAFNYCAGITNLSIGNDTENTKGIIEARAFRRIGPQYLAAGVIDLYVGSSIDSIGDRAFDARITDGGDADRFNNIKSATINSREIGGFQTFYNQGYMTGVTFGSGVKIIGRSVGEGADTFQGCSSLTKIEIPDPENIWQYSFRNCPNITGVYIGNDTENTQGRIETSAFRRVGLVNADPSVGDLYVGSSIDSIEASAFTASNDDGTYRYRWITSAELNCRNIGTSAFRYQRNMKEVTFGANVEQVGVESFNNCGITGDIIFRAGNLTKVKDLKILNRAFDGNINNKPRNVYLNGNYWNGSSPTTSDSYVNFNNSTWPTSMSGAFYVTGDGWTIGESAGPNSKPVRQWTTYPNPI